MKTNDEPPYLYPIMIAVENNQLSSRKNCNTLRSFPCLFSARAYIFWLVVLLPFAKLLHLSEKKKIEVNQNQNVPITLRRSVQSIRAWGLIGTCGRGTGVAIYDYADFGELLLKLPTPFFFCVENKKNGEKDDQEKFRRRFGSGRVIGIPSWPKDLDGLLKPYNLSHIYIHKGGRRDNVISFRSKNLIHAVFNAEEPHGDCFAKIGPQVPGGAPIVPYMVRPFPHGAQNLREKLLLADSETVICRYGGFDQFNIKYVQKAVVKSTQTRNDITFLFVNTKKFTKETRKIRFLPSISSDESKAEFIRTCDAMIHARMMGETFGLAIAEFAIMHRRVITEDDSSALHLRELQGNALVYNSYGSVLKILMDFDKNKQFDMSAPNYKEYEPETVMEQFSKVFLNC